MKTKPDCLIYIFFVPHTSESLILLGASSFLFLVGLLDDDPRSARWSAQASELPNAESPIFQDRAVVVLAPEPEPQPQPEAPAGAAARFTVTADSLNVRSGPDKSNAAVGTVQKGTVVTAVAEQNGWRQITAPVAGWVSAQYLQAVPTAKFTVTADSLNVRSGPDKSNEAVGTVSRGIVVTSVAEQDGWRQITSPVSGWVSAKYLEAAVPAHA